jgi:transposase-like protein
LIQKEESTVMSKSVIEAAAFCNEAAAYAWVESHVWPNGPICPHCGGVERIGKMSGKATRIGLYKCYQCRKQFTVKVGTVFEDSHVPMRFWVQAMYLLCSSKKGISSNQLHRTLGVTLKTAWFMSHRIREAMHAVGVEPMGGAGEVIEADETYIGTERPKRQGERGADHKRKVMALVQRGGSVRSFHVEKVNAETVSEILAKNASLESQLMTDESGVYSKIGRAFVGHETVNHSAGEYVRGKAHTNTIEGVFSVFKRGMIGIYQHCGENHLHRYLAEYDFRYNNRVRLGCDDVKRTERAIKGIVGKRLTYR